MKLFRRKVAVRLSVMTSLLALSLGWWIGWGDWPNPKLRELPWQPDVIMVLGGGNGERPREAMRLHREYPDVPVIVTGDGGMIIEALTKAGMPTEKIRHEVSAESTIENAGFTSPILDELNAEQVVIVTNWFHVPRSLAVFRRSQPGREFAASFEARPEEFDNWHRYASRRERLAALLYLVRHQIWSF